MEKLTVVTALTGNVPARATSPKYPIKYQIQHFEH